MKQQHNTNANAQRQQLEARRDALQTDLLTAQAAMAQTEAAAAPLLRLREERMASRLIVGMPSHTAEESALLRAHEEAEARLVAVEEHLADVTKELAALDRVDAAKEDGAKAARSIAKAEELVKTTSTHLAKVRQLKAVKDAELQTALRTAQAAQEHAARTAVAALLGQTVPTPAEALDEGAVPRLEAVINQLNIELARAEREAEGAQAALNDLQFPILQGKLLESREAFTTGLAALLPHLNAWSQASGKLGFGWRVDRDVDLPTMLRTWQQANGLPT